jgi:hypothetical protein
MTLSTGRPQCPRQPRLKNRVRHTGKRANAELALTENDMLSIEPGRHHSGDKELRTIGIGASIGHREKARLAVGHLKVLI